MVVVLRLLIGALLTLCALVSSSASFTDQRCAAYEVGERLRLQLEWALKDVPSMAPKDESSCIPKWELEAIQWLRIEMLKSRLDPRPTRNALNQLAFIPFEFYRLDGDNNHLESLQIDQFDEPKLVHVRRLPGTASTRSVFLTLQLPRSTQSQNLALTIKGSHEVYLDEKQLKPIEASPYYVLDNYLYRLPARSDSKTITVKFLPTEAQRVVSARLTQDQGNMNLGRFLRAQLARDDDGHLHPWWTALWGQRISDATLLRGIQPWLESQLDGQSPWSAALMLLKTDNLDRYPQDLARVPHSDEERDWWRQLHYSLGRMAIQEERPSQAHRALMVLRSDPVDQRLADRLYAALLDDAGLGASAATLMQQHLDSLEDERQYYAYLENAELHAHSGTQLTKIALRPDATRSDMHAYLAWLYRSNQKTKFDRVRFAAWKKCPSCWNLFEIQGGPVFPALARHEVVESTSRARFDILKKNTQQSSHTSQASFVDTDLSLDPFTLPLATGKAGTPTKGIHTNRLHQSVRINPDGLSTVRIRRLLTINEPHVEKTIEFALEYIPERQHIVIRDARLRRANRVDLAPVETDHSTDIPEARLYYDTRRRVLTFSELQAGDTIYIDWSVVDHAADPELPGLDGWVFPLNERWPIHELSIDWASEASTLSARLTQTGKAPHQNKILRKDLPAIEVSGQRTNGYLILSPVQHWSALDESYLKTIEARYAPTPLLTEVAQSIVGKTSNKNEQLKQLFKAVQQRIHYIGLEMGDHSRTPSWAEDVWRRRLGDCKDKATLLIALAKALDIELKFTLVRTRLLPTIKYGLPTLALFDHALIYAPSMQRYLDPNDPDLGFETLPAVVQGAQAHIVGEKSALTRLPMSAADKELIKWTAFPVKNDANQWQVELVLTGHAAAHFLGRNATRGSHNRALKAQVRRLISGWSQQDTQMTISGDAEKTVNIRFITEPIDGRITDILSTLLSSHTAWFNQTQKSLYSVHDLARVFQIEVPLDPKWKHSKASLDLGYGVLSIQRTTRQNTAALRLRFDLKKPNEYVYSEAPFSKKVVFELLSGVEQ